MPGIKCLVILSFLWTFTRGDTEVSCVFMESCILPCSFQGGKDVVVHWTLVTAKHRSVQSFYFGQDQLALQDQSFRGRTSLFNDQISRGNASLQLTGVKVQDQGRYKCYTSTIRGTRESLINLNVDAPVVRVDLQQVGSNITCSSEGIYPEPQLTWSTSPPSVVTLKNQTKLQETVQLLYNISGSLIRSNADLIYSCNISTRSNWRRVTLLKTASITASYNEATITCSTSNTNFSGLIWRFNHRQIIIILTRTRADVLYTVSEEWRQQVKGVSESGSLMLQDLSSHHEGTYTCELSDDEETLISNTVLRIVSDNSTNVGGIIGGVIAATVVVAVILTCCYRRKQGQQGHNRGQPVSAEGFEDRLQLKKNHIFLLSNSTVKKEGTIKQFTSETEKQEQIQLCNKHKSNTTPASLASSCSLLQAYSFSSTHTNHIS